LEKRLLGIVSNANRFGLILAELLTRNAKQPLAT
jgi:hypothetical protein